MFDNFSEYHPFQFHMRLLHFCLLTLLVSCVGREKIEHGLEVGQDTPCDYSEKVVAEREKLAARVGQGALLASRFTSYEDFKAIVKVEFFNSDNSNDTTLSGWSAVRLRHCTNGGQITSVLVSGLSQKAITKARDGDLFDRIDLLMRSPFTGANRKELQDIYLMARWRPSIFKEGDVAFYDLAERTAEHINTPELAFRHPRDSSEKGYINTFNHFIAQAIITSCFSEELADFIADVHELKNMEELTTGNFTKEQLTNPGNNPVDNYVDIINNEWGQELGKALKIKYKINEHTDWNPAFLAAYLNEVQDYFSWSFQIGFDPYRPEDPVIRQFSYKMNKILKPIK